MTYLCKFGCPGRVPVVQPVPGVVECHGGGDSHHLTPPGGEVHH